MSKSPESIVLAVALVLLALGSAYLAYSFPQLSDIVGFNSMKPKGTPVKPLEDLASSSTAWNSPILWTEPSDHHRLFNSIDFLFYPSLYPEGDYIKKLDKVAQSPGGVLLSWYQKYGINITSGTVDREDPDGDGFSNIVEFKNEKVGERLKAADCDGSNATNPLDAKSHPDYLARLRLQQYESRPFHIKFNGHQQLNGIDEFQIYLSDVPSYSQPPLKKTGDQLGFEGYIVGPYHESIVTKVNPNTHVEEQVNESTLELDKPEIDFKQILVFQKDTDAPESTANFVMLMPSEVDKVIKVARGKILTVPYIPDTQFLVIAVKDDGATIRDTKTKKEYHILKLDPAEWGEVPLVAPPPAPKSP